MTDKADFRKHAKLIKKSLDFNYISNQIQTKILSSEACFNAECIMLYMALSDEVDISGVYEYFKSHGKKCCFPVVTGDSMIASDDRMGFTIGKFGISEPVGTLVKPSEIDLIFVPGVMFDVSLNRLGRGGGYYDRFLTEVSAFKIGICPDDLLIDQLPSESFDLRVDMVITEKRMISDVGKK